MLSRRTVNIRKRSRAFSTRPVSFAASGDDAETGSLFGAVVTALLAVCVFANGFGTLFGEGKAAEVFAPISEIHDYFDQSIRENEAAAAFFWGEHDEAVFG